MRSKFKVTLWVGHECVRVCSVRANVFRAPQLACYGLFSKHAFRSTSFSLVRASQRHSRGNLTLVIVGGSLRDESRRLAAVASALCSFVSLTEASFTTSARAHALALSPRATETVITQRFRHVGYRGCRGTTMQQQVDQLRAKRSRVAHGSKPCVRQLHRNTTIHTPPPQSSIRVLA